jgi:hypothetical protein
MVILRATSILGGKKEDKGMMCNITHLYIMARLITFEKCYTSSPYPLFVPLKLMWLLKLPLNQNLMMIYHKFNGGFKSHINFGRIKGGQRNNV